MSSKPGTPTWMSDKKEIILLVNRSGKNFNFDLPTGHYRLDAGRSMRTLRSILNIDQIKALVDEGSLVVEADHK